MKKGPIGSIALGAALLAGSASAQTVPVPEQVSRSPNPPLIINGAGVLAATYIPSLIVGIASPNVDDRWLIAPVIGPRIDLASRGCGGDDCVGDAGNKVLLVGNGVLQALGATALIAGFFVPRSQVNIARPMSLGPDPRWARAWSGRSRHSG